MKTAQDTFTALLSDEIAPFMKDAGFRRRDTTFRRQRGEAWQIVNFQRSRYSHRRKVSFVVNLGVSLPELTDPASAWQKRGWPLEYECDFRARLGRLVKGEDHWWDVKPLRPLGWTARPIKQALGATGFAWLEDHADTAALLRSTVADPSSIDVQNLHAFERLARVLDDDEAAAVAERERAAWDRGERVSRQRAG